MGWDTVTRMNRATWEERVRRRKEREYRYALKGATRVARPVRVVWPDGREEAFPSQRKAAQELNVSPATVRYYAKAGKPHRTGWRIEFVTNL